MWVGRMEHSSGGGWTGFTDEDLQKLKQSTTTDSAASKSSARRGGVQTRRGGRLAATTQPTPSTAPLAANQRLSQPAVPEIQTSSLRSGGDVSTERKQDRRQSEKSDNLVKVNTVE